MELRNEEGEIIANLTESSLGQSLVKQHGEEIMRNHPDVFHTVIVGDPGDGSFNMHASLHSPAHYAAAATLLVLKYVQEHPDYREGSLDSARMLVTRALQKIANDIFEGKVSTKITTRYVS